MALKRSSNDLEEVNNDKRMLSRRNPALFVFGIEKPPYIETLYITSTTGESSYTTLK